MKKRLYIPLMMALALPAFAEDFIPTGTQTIAAPWGQFREDATAAPEVIPDSDGAFSIILDYRFDTTGYFDDPAVRANLELAAATWSAGIRSDFPTVRAGTPLIVMNPSTMAEEYITLNYDIDDLVIFVATTDQIEDKMALAGPITRWYRRLDQLLPQNAQQRIEGRHFQPWAGFLAINPDGSPPLFVDETPMTSDDIPRNSLRRYDFFTLALHEMGHILGIGTSDIFFSMSGLQNAEGMQAKISGSGRVMLFYDAYRIFYGRHARSINDGQPVLLSDDQGHIRSQFSVGGQQDLMDQSLNPRRQFPTLLDWALLKDIGYDIVGVGLD